MGFVININESNIYDIISHLIFIPFLTLPYYLTGKSVFYQLMVIFYFFVGTIEIGHWLLMKTPFSITSLLVVLRTNNAESIEFFSAYGDSSLLFLIPYMILFIVTLKHPPKSYNSGYKFFLVAFISICIAFLSIYNFDNVLAHGMPRFARVTHAYMYLRKFNKAAKENTLKKVQVDQTINFDEQLFVLIIGESLSRNHMSIYGYPKNTTPKLKERDDLLVFNDVVSGYSFTLESVMSILTESNLENTLPYNSGLDIIDVFHSVGFKTYWISNQPPIGWSENYISVIGNKTDNPKFVNISNNSTYEGLNNSSYDEKVLQPFSEALNDSFSRKMIVVHLMGNHLSYSKRYPNNFEFYKGDTKKEKMLAQYHNSVRYNDFVVDSLFTLIKSNNLNKKGRIATAIYLSDHGENVYDELDRLGHHYVNTMPKVNVEIPFIVWLSNSYKFTDPAKVTTLKSNINRPFVVDDVFHAILDLNYIESPYFDKQRSIFNKNYNYKRRRILGDGKDYDKKIKMP